MSDKYLELAKEIVLSMIDKEKVTVFLFGSRASGDFRRSSDIDIGFLSDKDFDASLLRKIREVLEISRVPYHVDLIDFRKVESQFRQIALQDIIIWNKGINFLIN